MAIYYSRDSPCHTQQEISCISLLDLCLLAFKNAFRIKKPFDNLCKIFFFFFCKYFLEKVSNFGGTTKFASGWKGFQWKMPLNTFFNQKVFWENFWKKKA